MLCIVLKYNPKEKKWDSELETYDKSEAIRKQKELKKQGYNTIIDYDND